MNHHQQDFSSFDEYLHQGEPAQQEAASNWKTAIGLQAVDGLQPSAYLIDVAKRNIEGDTVNYLNWEDLRRALDWDIEQEFAKHSWYFRNALVRANYRNVNKDIEYSPIYLVRFFRNLLLGDGWVLKNRYLHIHPTKEWKEQPRLGTTKILQKVDRKGGQKTKDSILSLIASDPTITTTEMSKRLGINRSAISKHLKKLKEEKRIERIGPDKGGKWLIKE